MHQPSGSSPEVVEKRGEDEEACVVREVLEETQLTVRVERLLVDAPAEPADGIYTRWRAYLCSAVDGEAAPGGGEGANAERGWDQLSAEVALFSPE